MGKNYATLSAEMVILSHHVKAVLLDILYFTHQPMISQDLVDPPCNSQSRDTSMGGTKLTNRWGTCSVKQSNWVYSYTTLIKASLIVLLVAN